MENFNPTSGTSIHELYKKNRDNQYENMMNIHNNNHPMPNFGGNPHMEHMQPNLQGQMQPSFQQPNIQQPMQHHSMQQHGIQQPGLQQPGMQHAMQQPPVYRKDRFYPEENPSDIEDLVKDINSGLDDELVEVSEKPTKKIKKKETSNYTKYVPHAKEVALLVAIYYVLSFGPVQAVISKYIKYVNPDERGKVSNLGIVIYGLLIAVSFKIAKTYLL